MANKKKTLSSKSAQPLGKKPEQPESVTTSEERDATGNALLHGDYHLPGNSYW
jgi:hypothetical protein